MEMIRLDDLKAWRAKRIQSGDCSYDDMEALAVFIDQCEQKGEDGCSKE